MNGEVCANCKKNKVEECHSGGGEYPSFPDV